VQRVKLSYHSDGFAQFSGENPGQIISGRLRTGYATYHRSAMLIGGRLISEVPQSASGHSRTMSW
jgi:hypothetical protein